MTVNSSANSIILILFAFSDNLSAENSKLSAESGLCGLSLLGSMHMILICFTQGIYNCIGGEILGCGVNFDNSYDGYSCFLSAVY